jgi:hypothetical protein
MPHMPQISQEKQAVAFEKWVRIGDIFKAATTNLIYVRFCTPFFQFSPLFSPDFVVRRRRRAWIQGARAERAKANPDDLLKAPPECNKVNRW